MSNLLTPPDKWLREQFEHEWCSDCGRDHRHHTAVPFYGNWFARCDREPVFTHDGETIPDPEGYETKRDCLFCGENGETVRATHLAPQRAHPSDEWGWVPVCACHGSGWWEGSDYPKGAGCPAFIAQEMQP